MKKYTSIEQVRIDTLKKEAEFIHYFGLGFIQIKLTPETRMHFYAKELPPIISEEDLHDHRYDFTSHILSGVLRQEIFGIAEGNTHILELENCKENSPKYQEGTPCTVVKLHTQEFKKGSSYFIDHNTFHRVSADDAVTFLSRTGYKKEFARVLREVSGEKICPFSKKIPEKELWEIVDSMLIRAKN